MPESLRIHCYPLKEGIRPTPEFAKKELAKYAVNVGLKCGHGCSYCSSGALLRCHRAFKAVAESPFRHGYGIVDSDIPAKVAADAARKKRRGVVQLCTTVDAWCPAARQYNLGRRCLEALLAQPGWTVRILTKNAAVAEDFDLIAKHRERVLVGLSLTGTPDVEPLVQAVEPNASPISERMAVIKQAHALGLRTFGMLCPLLPAIGARREAIEELVGFLKECGVEEVFAEAVNSRGPGLSDTAERLRMAGFEAQAVANSAIRRQAEWSRYVVQLIADIQAAMRGQEMIALLRFLLYSTRLLPADRAKIEADQEGVIWL